MNNNFNNLKNIIVRSCQATIDFTKESFLKAKNGAKKVSSLTRKLVFIFAIIFVAIGIFATSQQFDNFIFPKVEAKEPETIVITETFVEGQLKTIGKFNPTDYEYALDKEINEPLKLFNKVDVPFTTKSLKVKFTGVVKASYKLEDLKYATVVDTVIFTIPSKPDIENFLTGQEAMIEEYVWLNPIESSDYEILADGVMADGLANAEAEGIYEKAEQDIKDLLTEHFAKLGFKVKFTKSYM